MEHVDIETGEVVRAVMPPAIAAAIVAVMGKAKMLKDDSTNSQGGYKYVSIDKFFEKISPIMSDAGLVLLIEECETEIRTNEKTGNPWLHAQYELTWMHASGALAPPLKRACAMPISGPQAYGALQSYVQKQFLRAVFQIPTGDKDADDTAAVPEGPGAKATGARPAANAVPANAAKPAATAAKAADDPHTAEAKRLFEAIRAEIHAAPGKIEIDDVLINHAADMDYIRKHAGAGPYNKLIEIADKRIETLTPKPADAASEEFPA